MRRPRGWKTTEIPFAFAFIGGDLVEQPPQRAAAQCRPEGGAGGEELPQGVPAVPRPRPPLPPRHRAVPIPGAKEWNGCPSSAVVLHSPVVTDLPIFFYLRSGRFMGLLAPLPRRAGFGIWWCIRAWWSPTCRTNSRQHLSQCIRRKLQTLD